MNRFFVVILFFSIFLATIDSRANNETDQDSIALTNEVLDFSKLRKVDDVSNLILIGSGIKNRQTEDSVALVCVDLSCREIQHVYFQSQSFTAYYFGVRYVVPNDDVSKTDFKKVVKRINLSFRKMKRHQHEFRNKIIVAGALFTLPLWALALPAMALPASTFAALYGGTGIAPGTLMLLGLYGIGLGVGSQIENGSVMSLKSGKVFRVILDQNGWNWSVDPKATRAKIFNEYVKLTSTSKEKVRSTSM